LDSYISQKTALEVDSIITHYVGLFNEREDLVQKLLVQVCYQILITLNSSH